MKPKQGPGFLDESDLSSVQYTPDQYQKVLAKYGSGNIVDAVNKIIAAANDPNILGAVSLIRIVKTNMSSPAQGDITLREQGSPVYAHGAALSQGAPGNLIQWQSEIFAAEVAPQTGPFAYAPAISGSAITLGVRVNGGALDTVSISAKMAPDALVSALESVPLGVLVNGGHKKLVSTAGLTLTAAPVLGSPTVLFGCPFKSGSLWANSPAVGDVAVIPLSTDYGALQTSVIAAGGNPNVGTYIVTAVSNTVTSATLTLQPISTVGALASATGGTSADQTELDSVF